MRLEMHFMITDIQIIYKLWVHIIFYFTSYKDNEIEVRQKLYKHPLIKLYKRKKENNLQVY